jgi:hypothetical protein
MKRRGNLKDRFDARARANAYGGRPRSGKHGWRSAMGWFS